MNQLTTLQSKLKSLRLAETADHLPVLLQEADSNDETYASMLMKMVDYEQLRRDEKQVEKRLKWATFPYQKTLDSFDVSEQQSMSKKQFNKLKELLWIEQLFNIILLGPPGVGKTHLAIGLGMQAINQGYKVIFTSMGELIHNLKTEEITRKSQTRMKRIRNADLVIIDDLMFMAMDQHEANLFFHLINDLYNNASIVLTSNKAPKEWGELLGDPAITTAILDRIIHRAEIIHLNGDSYRMKHRSSIFEEESVTN
ncbi:IS21-like element helper ATPase IstB [Virgibacillus sp. NKC19-16]|uniref:IS21-like element helper ATPase IstB n=1 Tax=Virgibacillus salidurans TaxID=2831673 RepID=UPI001F2FA250|nr:IS21-like element helper ATPase IstB [Virgibacillus sp. NKC19-16]UJL47139.1 IS21-like element helper ATPase IstB [Virgibacillus sp. NKC19-16]